MSKKIAIIGAGGHGKVVGEIALLNIPLRSSSLSSWILLSKVINFTHFSFGMVLVGGIPSLDLY